MKKYDYIIVGSGLFGSVFAHEATKIGKRCLVIDKRNHIGGNIFTENIEGINVHKYGAHIFHTSDKKIWDYVNSFVEFNRFTNSPIANYNGELYNLPFNMHTFHQLWGVRNPTEAKLKIQEQRQDYSHLVNPKNLEEQALFLAGRDIYVKLIKDYTEKQWGRPASELPSFIIRRLPFRFTFDNNYFNDTYQGIPIGGYTKLIECLLKDSEINLEVDYFDDREYYNSQANKIVFTGNIDQYFNFKFGKLEYRSLNFVNEILDIDDFQGNAVVNYTDAVTPFTRIIEHKHFEFGRQPKTVITREYPKEWKPGDVPYYPINDMANDTIYSKYKKLAEHEDNVIFGGRLAEYKYYDMHQIVASALKKFRDEQISH